MSGTAYYGGGSAIKALRNSSYKKKIILLIDEKTRKHTAIMALICVLKIYRHCFPERVRIFYKRQFQIAMGIRADFATISDMMVHIWGNYKNEIYNPYKNNM